MPRPIRLVVACADTKRIDVEKRHRLGRYARVAPARRLEAWIEALEQDAPGHAAKTIYAGVYWTAVKAVADDLASVQGYPALSIISAGYGLLEGEAPIHPYAATFSQGSADSIPAGLQFAWWQGLSHWAGPLKGAPRSITALTSAPDAAAMIVVGSPSYLKAAAADIATASHYAQFHRQPFVIISTGARATQSAFREYDWAMMQVDARLEQEVGVGKVALNARVAGHLVKIADYDGDRIDRAREQMEQLCHSLHVAPGYNRAGMTDPQVLKYIRAELRREPRASFSVLLRRLRDSGRACEYKRFRGLYRQLRAGD